MVNSMTNRATLNAADCGQLLHCGWQVLFKQGYAGFKCFAAGFVWTAYDIELAATLKSYRCGGCTVSAVCPGQETPHN